MGRWHTTVGAGVALASIGLGALALAAPGALSKAPSVLAGPVEPDGILDATPAPTPDCTPVRELLNVANFNIKAGKAYGGNRLPDIAEAIRAWDADVVLLQEVDRFRAGSGNIDQAAWLAEQLGYEFAYGANVLGEGESAYGTAILSRFKILETTNTPLPTLPGAEQRGLLRALVDAPGRPVSVWTTHLQHKAEFADLRMLQAQTVLEQVTADEHPAVLGGDFNSGATTPLAQLMGTEMTDAWAATGDGFGGTWPASEPKARIDYLFGKDLETLGVVVAEEQLSDHRALRAAYAYDRPLPDGCETPDGEETLPELSVG